MADSFLQGAEIGGGLVARAMEQRRQNALLPLQIQEMNFNMQKQAADIEMAHEAKRQVAEGSAKLAAIMKGVKPIDQEPLILQAGIEYPLLANTPGFQGLLKHSQDASKLSLELSQAETRRIQLQEQLKTREDQLKLAQDRLDFEKTKGTQFDAERAQFFKEEKNLKEMTDQFESLPDNAPGKPELQSQIEQAKKSLEMLGAKLKGPQTNFSVTSPEGQVTQFSMGSGIASGIGNVEGGLKSRGLVTKIAPKIAQYENAVELANQLDKSLQVGDLGILGLIKEYKGRILGDIAPGMVNQKTMENRNRIVALRESIVRDIPEGGRETEKQRQEVMRMLPSSGVFESVANAKVALKAVKDLMQMRARNYAAEIGRVPLVSMTPEQIQADYISDRDAIAAKLKKGLITRDEANAILSKSNEEHNQALTRFHP